MNDSLDPILAARLDGKASLEETAAAVSGLIDPARLGEIRTAIERLRDAGVLSDRDAAYLWQASGAAADETVFAPAASGSADETVFAPAASGATDETVFAPTAALESGPAEDATILAPIPGALGAGSDFTVIAPEHIGGSEDTPDATVVVPSGPATGANAATRGPIGPGSIIKGRFKVENRLGQGGMGMVFKAVDMLRAEARDRNPHVAIKLLNESFKVRPDSFIALQREASRAQRLAHPNIATVFDFDRDGDTVFMTMELLEGQPLNEVIAEAREGLPKEQAFAMLSGLGSGLGYAHEKKMVHSDLKPSNAFLTQDGTVKLLDFGIARAANVHADAEGEETHFDAASLGALTPAYATVEMFSGKDPDPRDDIYALGCIAYELLTGRHPYNKLSAPKALEKGLSPAPVPGLKRRQQAALRRALAFDRAERMENVSEFIDALTGRSDRKFKYYLAGGVASLIAIGLLAAGPIQDAYYERQNVAQLVDALQSRNVAQVSAALDALETLEAERRSLVLTGAQEGLVGHFLQRARDHADPLRERHAFGKALELLSQGLGLYPHSEQLAALHAEMVDERNRVIRDLRARFEQAFAERRLLPDYGRDSVPALVERMLEADPNGNPAAHPGLLPAYRSAAETAYAEGNHARADTLLTLALRFSPADSDLGHLQDQVSAQLVMNEFNATVSKLRTALGAPENLELAQLDAHVEAIGHALASGQSSDYLDRLQERAGEALARPLEQQITAGNWQEAEALLARYAPVLSVSRINAARARLTAEENAAGDGAALMATDADMAALKFHLEQALESGSSTTELLSGYKRLLAGDRDGRLAAELGGRITAAMAEQVGTLASEGRFNAARRTLVRLRAFAPEFDGTAELEARIADGERNRLASISAEERLKRTAQLRQNILLHADYDRLEEMEAAIEQLRALSNGADNPLSEEEIAAAADLYVRTANGIAAGGDHQEAIALLQRAHKLVGAKRLASEQVLIKQRQRVNEVRRAIGQGRLSAAEPLIIELMLAQPEVPEAMGLQRQWNQAAEAAKKNYRLYQEALERSRPDQAKQFLEAARRQWADNKNFEQKPR